MRLLPLIYISLLAACGGQSSGVAEPKLAAEAAPEKSTFVLDDALPPAVYSNDAGVQLTIIALKQEGDEQHALIQFKGVRHPLSGKALLATAKLLRGGSYVWRVQYHGGTHWLVRIERGSRGSLKLQTSLVLPRTGMSSSMQFSSALTAKLDWRSIADLHEKHTADGSLVALAEVPSFDLVSYKKEKQERFKYPRKTIAQACGDIPMEMDWSNVSSDNSLEDVPCIKGLTALVQACTRSVHSKGVVRAKTKRIVCTAGPEYGYSWDSDGTLTVVSSRGIPDVDFQKELASEYGFGNIVVKNELGYLIFNPDSFRTMSPAKKELFIGDGVTFHRHRLIENLYLWSLAGNGFVRRVDGKWTFKCDVKGTTQTYMEVVPEQAKKLLSKATYGDQLWKRTPVSLSRDTRGHYYYVDRLQNAYGGKDFRVYKGLRGKLRRTQLVDIIDDGSGRIFSTQQGELRLLVAQEQSTWIVGKKAQTLTAVWNEGRDERGPGGRIATLIYKELGVYDGQELGAICY